MDKECIFCRIVSGEVSSDIVYQDKDFLAFRDISPQSPTHVLIVPKTHIASLNELTKGQQEFVGQLIIIARNLAKKEGIARRGYRLVINSGPEAGQMVPHLHLHIIGGRRLTDKLG
jgi:histidine triad (HIT) family protein